VHADELAVRLAANLETTRQRSAERAEHPEVYFVECDEPMISSSGWISELIAIAGGVDIFPELAGCKSAKDRITTPEAVIARAPDIIIGSGLRCHSRVRSQKLCEIESALILQPGPVALTDGLAALENIILGAQ
jgi:iron complex transport system substrate-binding protein